MNYTELLRQCVAYFSFAVASIFVLSLVGFLLRRQLRVLLDRWRALGRLGQCVTLVFVSGFVLYGGSKHLPPSPPSDDDPLFSPESMAILLRSMEQGISTPQHSPLTDQSLCASASLRDPITITQSRRAAEASGIQSSTLPHWAARGAWVDWQRIEFPEGFAFPIGTNQITEVTLMSYGELRTSLNQPTNQPTNQQTNQLTNQPLISLPRPVSLEPGESSIHYGLTPSNSFLIAWENVCVERSATNRVDALIELFRNGDTLVTVQPINQSTNSPTHQPTTIFTPAALPQGWVEEGQNLAWATNAFPEFAEDIRTNGYVKWLAGYIGVNEANGRFQVKVSVMTLPDGPCYLACGPYRIVVKEPGVYCFPLEYFTRYQVRTYPTAVPLTFEYDDGYRPNPEEDDMGAVMAFAPRQNSHSTPGDPEPVYEIDIFPQVYIHPNAIPLDQALNQQIDIFCKAKNITSRRYTTLWGQILLNFTGPSAAVIQEAEVQAGVLIMIESQGHTCSGMFTITEPWYQPSTNECDNVSTNDFGIIGGTNGTSSVERPGI